MYSLKPPSPFNLEATVKTHGWFQLIPFYWDEKTKSLGWAMELQNGTIELINLAQQNVDLVFNFKNSEMKNENVQMIKDKISHVFNLNLDLADFYKTCRATPYLAPVIKRGMGRLMRSENVFQDLVKSICGTNCQWKQAVNMINRIGELGDNVPGTDFHIFPTPDQILAVGEEFLRDTARLGYRAPYIIELCERFMAGEIQTDFVENGSLPPAELKKFFMSVKGIGKITSHYLMALYGHFEEMAVDRLVISFMAQKHFNGRRPTEKEIEAFYAPFGKWRYLAYWMEFIISDGWKPEG